MNISDKSYGKELFRSNSYDSIPFARILYDGVLIALISTTGTILYSQAKGDAILGSFSSTRGRNILEYIQKGDGYEQLKAFFSHNGKHSQEVVSHLATKNFFETRYPLSVLPFISHRFGHHVSLEVNPNFSLNDFPNSDFPSSSPPPRVGLLSLANLQSSGPSDELSFNDAFGY